MRGWRSPRLGITFGLDGLELNLNHPDGSRFLSFVELSQRREEAEERAFAEMMARADMEEALTAAEARVESEAKSRAEAEARVHELEEKLRAAGLL